jgi:DNA-binding Lrp family transcriptional regulator
LGEEGSVKAYVLIHTQAEREPLAQRLRALPQVVSAEDLTGPYDAIAVVRPRSVRHLVEEIIEEIRKLPGVIRALPLPLVPHAMTGPTPESSFRHPGSRDEAA